VMLFILLIPFASSLCSDSDGGNVPETFGYVLVNDVKYADTCTSTTKLTEYYFEKDLNNSFPIYWI